MKTTTAEIARQAEIDAVLKRLLPADILSPWRAGGKWKWTPWALAVTALAWALVDKTTLGARFAAARTFAGCYLGRSLPTSIQGFHKALGQWQELLLALVQEHLQQTVLQLAGRTFRSGGLVPLVVDGTRIDTPRSAPNEARFRTRRKGSCVPRTAKQQAHADVRPQIWLTLVWHMTLRLPWSWRLGPYGSSERAHLLDMLGELPSRTLLVCDAGFTGYDFWENVLSQGHQLLVRVGRNVQLLSQLACTKTRGDLVFLWPEAARRKDQPPLVLRQVKLTRKRRVILLVTSLLDEAPWSNAELARLYRQRWGIEVFHRSLKQTFARGKLRSHSPAHAVSELQWSLVALTGVQLLGVDTLRQAHRYRQRSSTARALAGIRNTFWPPCAYGRECSPSLRDRLLAAVNDRYRRRRKVRRRYPQKKRTRPPGMAQIIPATRAQQIAATPYLIALPA